MAGRGPRAPALVSEIAMALSRRAYRYALAMFAPVLVWNADHEWVSLMKQFGRVLPHGFRLQHRAGFIPGQLLLATPAVFLLGASGL